MSEEKNKGWIKLSREITDHWLWSEEFSRGQAWIDLLIHASHSDSQKMIIKGEVISWGRGQQIRSIKTLCDTWKWSRSKVNRFLDLLEKDNMIERKGGHLTTIISICNYDSFQGSRTSVDTSDELSVDTSDELSVDTSDGHLTDISRATNKNVNKEKNVNNENKSSNLPAKAEPKKTKKFIPPTLEQVYEFMGSYAAKKNKVIGTDEPEKFIDFYESKNWYVGNKKMASWEASARGWVGRIKDSHLAEASNNDWVDGLVEGKLL